VRRVDDILAALGRRLQSVRYGVSDLAFVAGRAIERLVGSLARGASDFWARLSPESRRRLPLAAGAALLAALLLALVAPDLPCRLPGGESCPPGDDAAELVPADALAYAHVNLDPETEQYRLARASAASAPLLFGQITTRALAQIPGPQGRPPEFGDGIAPWFGGEAAIAVLGAGAGAATQVELLEAGDEEGAARYADSIAAGRVQGEEYRGIEIETDQRGLATASVEGFLAIGRPEALRAVIDVATGAEGAGRLAADATAGELRDELPEQRLADAYLSQDGVVGLAGDRGALGSLAPLASPGASRGAAAALTATEGGFELAVRSELDPERAGSAPGFFAAFPPFDPSLPELLPARSLAYLGFGDPGATVRALVSQASAQAPGIAAGFERLVTSLRREGDVDLERDLLDALGSEAALVVGAPPAAAARPYLELVTAGVDEQRARRALGALQGPLADAVDPGSDLQAPVFGEREIAGVEARSLQVSPTVELTTAVFGGLAVIATDPAALGALATDQDRLADSDLYGRATDELGEDEGSLLGYLDLGALVAIGERLGLAEDPAYVTFAAEFRRLEGFGLAVSSSDEMLSTDARLLLAPPAGDAVAPQSSAPPD
jgi:hypothetical protein